MSDLIYTGSSWNYDKLYRMMDACEEIAINDMGLDCFPNQIEIITFEQMLDAYSSVGMPLMYNHWSFGKSFIQNKKQYSTGQMGLAYELVINSNPCINYLMEENSMTTQSLVIAHAAFGHNHFFKNNYLFKQWTSPDAIVDYLLFAKRYIRECEEKYGVEAVEETLDACHAIQYQSINKYKRPNRLNAQDEIEKQRTRSEYLQSQVNDLWRTLPESKKEEKKEEKTWPSEPEENLLYFLEKYSPILTPWQREICRIVRRIAQYFYPQYQTKVMNEGFASFTHHYIFNKLYDQGKVDDGSMIEFFKLHSAVLYQPPFSSPNYNGFNPYALGFAILKDIQRVCTEPDEEDKRWFPHLADTDWRIAVKDIAANYRDESAILQFLGPKVIRDQGLFNLHDEVHYDNYIVTSIHNERGYKKIRKNLSASYETAAMIPDIQVTRADIKGSRDLTLLHESYKGKRLNQKTANQVLTHVQKLWGYKVKLYTMHDETLLDVFECNQVSNSNVGSLQMNISDDW
jgi:spore cortex formation protein SpoVR/YcgB (stage V sporulation)